MGNKLNIRYCQRIHKAIISTTLPQNFTDRVDVGDDKSKTCRVRRRNSINKVVSTSRQRFRMYRYPQVGIYRDRTFEILFQRVRRFIVVFSLQKKTHTT